MSIFCKPKYGYTTTSELEDAERNEVWLQYPERGIRKGANARYIVAGEHCNAEVGGVYQIAEFTGIWIRLKNRNYCLPYQIEVLNFSHYRKLL